MTTPGRRDPLMEVVARLALFVGALVVAVVAGWGLGQLAGPHLTTFTPNLDPSTRSAPHTHPESP